MKGQTNFAPDVLSKALSFLIMTIALVGTLVAYFQYQVVYESFNENRQAIDFAENLMSSKCLVYEENGNFFKGVFDKSKLDKRVDSCIIKTDNIIGFEILDESGQSWSSGIRSVKNSITYPVVVRYTSKYVSGRLEVFIS